MTPALENVTVGEQQELSDVAWLILKKHNAVADAITYQLAREISNAVTATRDRQVELKRGFVPIEGLEQQKGV